MVPHGVTWRRMALRGVAWCHMVSRGVALRRMVPGTGPQAAAGKELERLWLQARRGVQDVPQFRRDLTALALTGDPAVVGIAARRGPRRPQTTGTDSCSLVRTGTSHEILLKVLSRQGRPLLMGITLLWYGASQRASQGMGLMALLARIFQNKFSKS